MSAPIDGLVEALGAAFGARDGPGGSSAAGKEIAALLGDYARSGDDWQDLTLFDREGYTRNLVARQGDFELLILGWGSGQESPIHNHEGQDCWMAVLDGPIEERRYLMPEGGGAAPLQVRETRVYESGEVGFIRDEMGLHLVRPAVQGRRAVSLHLYAAPYGECNVYCPETGRVTRKRLVDFSVRGRPLSPLNRGAGNEGARGTPGAPGTPGARSGQAGN